MKEEVRKIMDRMIDQIRRQREIEVSLDLLLKELLRRLDFLSEEDGRKLMNFLSGFEENQLEMTITRIDCDADTGRPSHNIFLRGENVLQQCQIDPEGIEDLDPEESFNQTIKAAKELKSFLERGGISVKAKIKAPKTELRPVEVYSEEPLDL